MRCLVFVEFLPGGSIPPAEFFLRMKAIWSYVKNSENQKTETGDPPGKTTAQFAKSGICVADYDSIEQLTADLAIMPGAGISNVQIFPLSEHEDVEPFTQDLSLNKLDRSFNKR